MDKQRFGSALRKAFRRMEQEQWITGKLGKLNADGTYTFDVTGRPGFVNVTIRNANGAQTVVAARNDARVEHAAKLSVKMRLEYGVYVLYGRDGRADLGNNPVSPPYGVVPHGATHENGGGDDIGSITPGAYELVKANASGKIENGYLDLEGILGSFVEGSNIDIDLTDPDNPVLSVDLNESSAKVTPIDADSMPLIDSADSNILKKVTWANIKATLETYFDMLYEAVGSVATHAALTIAHGATGAVVGTTNSQALTNKTLDSSNISSLTDKNPPVDADGVVIVDSAASSVFKSVTWANIKATLKTYNDGLYVDLTTNQTVAGLKSFTNNQIRIGSSAHVEPYTGYDAQGNVAAIIRYATAHAISTPFVSVLFSNNQTDGSNGLIGSLVFMNEAIAATEKRLAQISVYTDAATDEGKLIIFTWDGTISVEALALDKSGIATFGNDVIVPSGVITIGVPEMSPTVRSLEIGDNGVAGGAQIRTSSTTDNGLIFHDENLADDEWLINHIVSDNSLRLAGWRTTTSGAVTEHIKVLLGGEVVISGAGTSPALTGNMLAVYGSVAKATASKNNVASFGSSDTANQMQLRIQVLGSGTATSRAAGIQAVEAGVAVRALLLNPDGGNVGVSGVTDPDAPITIATPDSTLVNGEYQISLRSERTTINTTDALIGGIEFVSNDTNLTAPGTTTAVMRAIARSVHTTTELSTAISFLVTNVTTIFEAMRIESDGDILLSVVRALTSSGVRIEDDAGNLGVFVEDGGNVGINTANPEARLDILESTLGNAVFKISSTATNDDPNQTFYHQRVATTNATPTTALTIPIAANTFYVIEALVIGRRTGGTSGATNDYALGQYNRAYTNTAGVVSQIYNETAVTSNSAGATVDMSISGTNVVVTVTGLANNNYTWHVHYSIRQMAS